MCKNLHNNEVGKSKHVIRWRMARNCKVRRSITKKKKNSSENFLNFSQKFFKIRLKSAYFQTSTSRVQFSKNSQNFRIFQTFRKIRKDIKLSDIEVEQGLKVCTSTRIEWDEAGRKGSLCFTGRCRSDTVFLSSNTSPSSSRPRNRGCSKRCYVQRCFRKEWRGR